MNDRQSNCRPIRLRMRGSVTEFSTVAADGFYRAFLECGQAVGFFRRIEGLMEDKAAVLGLIAFEIARGRFATKIAVDARRINVETARDVFGYSVVPVGHAVSRFQSIGPKRSIHEPTDRTEEELASELHGESLRLQTISTRSLPTWTSCTTAGRT